MAYQASISFQNGDFETGLGTGAMQGIMQALGRQLTRGPRDVGLRRLSYPKVPLSEALPQFTETTGRSGPIVAPERREPAVITHLQNGLRVASESAYGQFCAVGGEPVPVVCAWSSVQDVRVSPYRNGCERDGCTCDTG